jgi:hypothetical protein
MANLQKPTPSKAKKLPRPYQADLSELTGMQVYMPDKMLAAFKSLAAERSRQQMAKVPARALYDEAVKELLADLRKGRSIFYSPNPIQGAKRKTIWIWPKTMEDLRETGHRLNIQYAQLGFTALIQYLARRGITFEGFPTE